MTPASDSSASASRKNCRARSIRPRVPISTAALTRSGRASMSSWVMKAPIDIPTMRAGAALSPSISATVSATIVCVEKPSGVLRGADPAIVEGDDAVSGRQKRGDLIGVPGPSGAAVAGDKDHGLTGAAVVVSQVDHPDDGTSSG